MATIGGDVKECTWCGHGYTTADNEVCPKCGNDPKDDVSPEEAHEILANK